MKKYIGIAKIKINYQKKFLYIQNKNLKKIISSDLLPLITLIIIVSRLAWISVFQWGPSWQHDYPSYHLPFIARDFNLSNWELFPSLLPIWDGYAPLTHFVQGLIILLTDHPPLANAINGVIITIFIFICRKNLQSSKLIWLLLSFFALPLFLINFPTGGNDIWTAFCVLIQFIFLSIILNNGLKIKHDIVFIIFSGFAMLSKMNVWAITPFFVGVYLWNMFLNDRSIISEKFLKIFWLFFAIGIWPLRNWIVMGSPTWPIPLPPLFPDGSFGITPVVYPELFQHTYRPILYLISFFELSRFASSEPMHWSFTMWHGGPKSPHQMMGGLNGFFMFGAVILLIVQTIKKMIPTKITLIFLMSIIITSFTVQSYEMRYSLYIPMILLYILINYSSNFYLYLTKFFIVINLIIVVQITYENDPYIFSSFRSLLNEKPQIKNFWDNSMNFNNNKTIILCIPDTDKNIGNDDPLGIYFTGPHLREFNAKICEISCAKWERCGFEW